MLQIVVQLIYRSVGLAINEYGYIQTIYYKFWWILAAVVLSLTSVLVYSYLASIETISLLFLKSVLVIFVCLCMLDVLYGTGLRLGPVEALGISLITCGIILLLRIFK